MIEQSRSSPGRVNSLLQRALLMAIFVPITPIRLVEPPILVSFRRICNVGRKDEQCSASTSSDIHGPLAASGFTCVVAAAKSSYARNRWLKYLHWNSQLHMFFGK